MASACNGLVTCVSTLELIEYPDCPELFQTVQNFSRMFRNCPDYPEIFQRVWTAQHCTAPTCFFTRLDRVYPGPSRVSDSPVSAENVISEDFVLIEQLW